MFAATENGRFKIPPLRTRAQQHGDEDDSSGNANPQLPQAGTRTVTRISSWAHVHFLLPTPILSLLAFSPSPLSPLLLVVIAAAGRGTTRHPHVPFRLLP